MQAVPVWANNLHLHHHIHMFMAAAAVGLVPLARAPLTQGREGAARVWEVKAKISALSLDLHLGRADGSHQEGLQLDMKVD